MTRSRASLGLLGVGLIVLGLGSPMLLIFPMWIFTFLFRRQLRAALARVPGGAGFLVAAVAFGLATECFAIATNLSRPAADRILLDADPARDLAFGLIYYSAVAMTWWLLLRRWRFNERDVFAATALYGVCVEQTGLVLLGIFTWPVLGAVYAVFVAFVYGLFPMLALVISGDTFSERPEPSRRGRAGAFGALMLQYLVVGGLLFPMVRLLAGRAAAILS